MARILRVKNITVIFSLQISEENLIPHAWHTPRHNWDHALYYPGTLIGLNQGDEREKTVLLLKIK